jgi:hypothetical protein
LINIQTTRLDSGPIAACSGVGRLLGTCPAFLPSSALAFAFALALAFAFALAALGRCALAFAFAFALALAALGGL